MPAGNPADAQENPLMKNARIHTPNTRPDNIPQTVGEYLKTHAKIHPKFNPI